MKGSITILRAGLVYWFSFGLSCSQNSTAIYKTDLAAQPTPPMISSNTFVGLGDRKYYSPSDSCQKIKSANERSLCEAIIKEQGLTGQVLNAEFVYTNRRIDLNSDGHKEVLVWVPVSDLGGTGGYPIIIFAETPDGFQKLWGEQAWTPILLLKSKSNGWRDVAFQVAGGGVETHYVILRHNGKSYKSSKTQEKQPQGAVIIDKDWKQTVFGPMSN